MSNEAILVLLLLTLSRYWALFSMSYNPKFILTKVNLLTVFHVTEYFEFKALDESDFEHEHPVDNI